MAYQSMAPGPAEPTPGPGPPGPAAGNEQGQSALLPRNLFGDGVKPGDTITMKVSAIYGDEVEVLATASSGEGPEEEDEEMEESKEMTADQEIEAAGESVNYGSDTALG